MDTEIGVRLRELRLTAGVSQKQLGAAIGKSYVHVQKYESGANRIAVATLVYICHALGLSPMDFIGQYFEPSETADGTEYQPSTKAVEQVDRLSSKPKPNDFRRSWHPKRKLRLHRG
jgi:transcriptional regulator with XRE-family HTH domain